MLHTNTFLGNTVLKKGMQSELFVKATESAVFTCVAVNKAGPSIGKTCDFIFYSKLGR